MNEGSGTIMMNNQGNLADAKLGKALL